MKRTRFREPDEPGDLGHRRVRGREVSYGKLASRTVEQRLLDVGARHRFGSRYSGQLGVALLYAAHARQTCVNPTICLGVLF